MGSSDPASYDALSTESGVDLSSASWWSEAPMTVASFRSNSTVVPTICSVGGHRRHESYIGAELAR